MKRIKIIVLTIVTAFSVIGCTQAKIEKEPVIITDAQENTTNNVVLTPSPLVSPTSFEDNKENTSASSENSSKDSTVSSKDTSNNSNITLYTDRVYPVTLELEGSKEQVNYETYESPLNYRMAYDIDRFTIINGENVDIYAVDNPNPELYPYIYISITRNEFQKGVSYDTVGIISDYFKNKYTDSIYKMNNKGITSMKSDGTVMIGEYKANHFYYQEGTKWNSIICDRYFLYKGNYDYIIDTQYFYEASEGYGKRIKALLNTLVLE